MVKINENFAKLPGGYLFSEVARRIAAWTAAHPEGRVIRLSIGDVTRPLIPAVVEELSRAAAEMGTAEGFRGYGPEGGYPFLREVIAREDYAALGVDIGPEEIFISDGAKSDCAGIVDLFDGDNRVAVCDPVYPVYVDSNALAGRAGEYRRGPGRWSGLTYMPCTQENGFLPRPPEGRADLIYLCFPNNPTGAAATREELRAWVDYANARGSVILFDGAYQAFITSPDVPRSIFEIPGAEACATEFRSFSKTAGFTGTRCGYTVIPKALRREGASLNALWARRQATKCNGVSYLVQRGAAAVYTPEGRAQVRENLAYYQENARVIREGLSAAGRACFGGVDAPYIWLKTPDGLDSWGFFDLLLEEAQVAVTPGAGFGPSGEGYVRLTAFGEAEDTRRAVERVRALL